MVSRLQAVLTISLVIRDENNGFCGEAYAVDELHKRAAPDIKLILRRRRGVATDALKTLIAFVFKTETDAGAVWTEPSGKLCRAQALRTLRPEGQNRAGGYGAGPFV